MRKKLTLGALCLTILVSLLGVSAQAGLTLTSPNGGETWTAGTTVQVTWTSTPDINESDEIRILVRDGQEGPGAIIRFVNYNFVSLVTVADGTADFLLPTWLSDGDNYYVEIQGGSFAGIHESDRSDAPLTIAGSLTKKRLTLTSPTKNARWRAGSRGFVSWDSIGADSAVVNAALDPIDGLNIPDVPATDGSTYVPIPVSIGNGTSYRLMLTELAVGAAFYGQAVAFDQSPPFEIYDAQERPSFSVTSPNGNEIVSGGAEIPICWDTTATEGDFVGIPVGGGSFIGNQFTFVPLTDGCADRTICPHVEGGDFRMIGAAITGGMNLFDRSDESFVVLATTAAPTLTVTSHNNGGTLTPGMPMAVTWTSTGFVGMERIVIYLKSITPDSETVTLLANPRVKMGTANVTLCPTLTGNAVYRIRMCGSVSTGTCPQVCDESDQPFSISPIPTNASIQILSPAGGEIFESGHFVDFDYIGTNAAGLNIDVRIQREESTVTNAFASGIAVNGHGNFFVRLQIPGSFESRAYRFDVQLKAGACTLYRTKTNFFTVGANECTCADVNSDLRVDQVDGGLLVGCMDAGSQQGQAVAGSLGICGCSDLDGTDVVDLRDFAVFQNLFGVGAAAEPPNCPQAP